MKDGKPKGRNPSLIGGSNGRPKRANVKRRGECSRCHCTLEAGTDCFEIPKVGGGGGFTRQKRYCQECFKNILRTTAEDLNEMWKL